MQVGRNLELFNGCIVLVFLVWIFLTLLNCTLKNPYDGNFHVYFGTILKVWSQEDWTHNVKQRASIGKAAVLILSIWVFNINSLNCTGSLYIGHCILYCWELSEFFNKKLFSFKDIPVKAMKIVINFQFLSIHLVNILWWNTKYTERTACVPAWFEAEIQKQWCVVAVEEKQM